MYRNSSLYLVLASLAVFVGCSSEGDKRPPAVDAGGGTVPPPIGSGGSGGMMDEEVNGPGAPVVTLNEPTESTDGSLVYDETVQAQCTVVKSEDEDAQDVDEKSITLELLDSEQMVVETVTPMAGADGYEGQFEIKDLDSGEYTVRCSATDTSETPRRGSSEAKILIDHGPKITLVSPLDSAFASNGLVNMETVHFEFLVRPSNEAGAGGSVVDAVTLTIEGQSFPATLKGGTDNTYEVDIDLTDSLFFPEIPVGETAVVVSATDSRENPVTSSIQFTVNFDGTPPEITLVSPESDSVVGGDTTMEIRIVDAGAGLNWDTVKVTLGSFEFLASAMSDWEINMTNGNARFSFSTFDLTATERDIAFTIEATDVVGNSRRFEGQYRKDEVAPILMLDPPLFRVRRQAGTGPDECSHAFDPVGFNVPSHGENTGRFKTFRALVYDDTNASSDSGASANYFAGTDPDSVTLHFSPAVSGALVTDSDSDGLCDAIDESVSFPQALEALRSRQGSAYFGDGTGDLSGGPPLTSCVYDSTPTSVPDTLCDNNSDLQYVSAHNAPGREPIVYANAPAPPALCSGVDTELVAQGGLETYEGWICVAARGSDNVGNQGVSEPIALCLDNPNVENGIPSCWDKPGEAPSCTDGCTPFAFPERWRIVDN